MADIPTESGFFTAPASGDYRHPPQSTPLEQQEFASHPEWSSNTWQGRWEQYELVGHTGATTDNTTHTDDTPHVDDTPLADDTTHAAPEEEHHSRGDFTSAHSNPSFAWVSPTINPPPPESHRPQTAASSYIAMPVNSEQGHFNMHQPSNQAARVTGEPRGHGSIPPSSHNFTYAAAQPVNSATGQRMQVPTTSRHSVRPPTWNPYPPRTPDTEPTNNESNIRALPIQPQRAGPSSSSAINSSSRISKLPTSAEDSTMVTSPYSPSLSSSAIGYQPGRPGSTQVFNPYPQVGQRRTNRVVSGARTGDARVQPTPSAALGGDAQTDQPGSDIVPEMKALLDKMDELRHKDPAMFQRLLLQKLFGSVGKPPDSSPASDLQSPFSQGSQAAQGAVSHSDMSTSRSGPMNATSRSSRPQGLEPKETNVEGSRMRLTALGSPSAQSDSTGRGNHSIRPPNNPSTNAPATTSAIVGSGEDESTNIRLAAAKTTLEELKSVRENNTVDITVDELYSMLKPNLPFVEFCDSLERRGLKFHRGHLARRLVANVPNITGGTRAASMSPNKPQMATTPAWATRPNTLGPGANHTVTNEDLESTIAAAQKSTQTEIHASSARPFISVKPGEPKKVHRKKAPSASARHSPVSTARASRKRSFSQLLGRVHLGDEDDHQESNKDAQIEKPAQQESTSAEKHPQFTNTKHRPLGPKTQDLNSTAHAANSPVSHPGKGKGKGRGKGKEKKTILAQPIKRSDALRHRWYDPKTVASDILIAAGKHPYERALNAHMAPLLDKYINLDSDLSTLDWNAIDPGGPPIRAVAPVSIPRAIPRPGIQGKHPAGQ